MQLNYGLARQGDQLIVTVQRKRKLIGIGPIPPGVYNRVRYLHEAGAEIELDPLDSAPKQSAIHFSLWISGEEIEDLQGQVREIRKSELNAERARQQALELQRQELQQRRKARRDRVFRSIRSVCSSVKRGVIAIKSNLER